MRYCYIVLKHYGNIAIIQIIIRIFAAATTFYEAESRGTSSLDDYAEARKGRTKFNGTKFNGTKVLHTLFIKATQV